MPDIRLPAHKTKIVCTIGPASDSLDMLKQMMMAGMNIARLNFSHGNFDAHRQVIKKIRQAARETGFQVAIMADLPGPKIRIGQLKTEPITLVAGDHFILTSENIIGDNTRVYTSLENLAQVVQVDDIIFLNDGQLQLRVEKFSGQEVHCLILGNGILRSRKGMNLPGIDLGISAFTAHDRDCMEFALKEGVDAISQSFVNDAADVEAVRAAAKEMGYAPFIIAKIERASIHDNLEEILQAADGVMVARGDLGVEVPIAQIAILQKQITRRANQLGKPVITATQMLESMIGNRRPTRAEATDVANAILDGTDGVMLSEESAMGKYPLEAVKMLVEIAQATEPSQPSNRRLSGKEEDTCRSENPSSIEIDYIANSVQSIVAGNDEIAAILCPTESGLTARRLSRFKLPPWILAISSNKETCKELIFSYGVYPLFEPHHPADWTNYARDSALTYRLKGKFIIQTEGPSLENPSRNHKMEIIDLHTVSQASNER